MNKDSLRHTFRTKRQQLSKEAQEIKAHALISILATLPEFTKSQKIAAYWPIDGEISPIPLIDYALKAGKHCYLPVLPPLNQKQLWFVEYKAGAILKPNRFHILEPSPTNKNLTPAQSLDLVLVPLVAFDATGKRLGMGQGYYDRTFAFLKNPRTQKPRLIGLAYEFQEAPSLPSREWDIPLYGIATEKKYIIAQSLPSI